jgi:hypothetical protein
MKFYGSAMRFPHVQGGFRELIVCSEAQAVPVPAHVAAEVAAFAEPSFKDAMAKTNLIVSYMDGEPFKAFMAEQSAYFKKLLSTVTIAK